MIFSIPPSPSHTHPEISDTSYKMNWHEATGEWLCCNLGYMNLVFTCAICTNHKFITTTTKKDYFAAAFLKRNKRKEFKTDREKKLVTSQFAIPEVAMPKTIL